MSKNKASPPETGYDPDSPWPSMRRDYSNTGRADDIKPSAMEDLESVPLWSFSTGGPIFFTPSVGPDGTVFVGSADFSFYAVNPDGTMKWRFPTDRYIVGGAAVSAAGSVYFPGADGYLHALDCSTGRELWRFASRNVKKGRVEMVGWFEGSVTLSPGGIVLAGNDDFYVYGLEPQGDLRFESASRGMVWSAIPTDRLGRHYFCSLDMCCYCVEPSGERVWKSWTLGFISGSPALGEDGTVYTASHDGRVYALDPDTGKKRWSLKTGDFICGSCAIGREGTLYVGTGDGVLYAIEDRGDQAAVIWRYHTLEPIRCSPVVDGDGNIYFANGEGKVFVIGPDGGRRWSFDLSIGDINNINGSMALGKRGIYLGMQDGRLMQVPYDYGLRPEFEGDPRARSDPGDDLPAEGATVYWVSPGGISSPLSEDPPSILPGNPVTLRLLVRKGGSTVPAGIGKRGLNVRIEPELPFHCRLSADRRYLNIVPDEPMSRDTTYRFRVEGSCRKPALRLFSSIWLLSGRRICDFTADVSFKTANPLSSYSGGPGTLLLGKMSAYQPAIFAGLAEIGFDDLNILAVPVYRITQERWIAWAVLARQEESQGYRVQPGNRVTLPVKIGYQGDYAVLEARDAAFDQGGDRFGLRLLVVSAVAGEGDRDGTPFSRNSFYAEGKSISMAGSFYNLPVFGAPLAGTVTAEFVDQPVAAGGLRVSSVRRSAKRIIAEYENPSGLLSAEHHLGILLVDEELSEPVRVDYPRATSNRSDARGRARSTVVSLPWFKVYGRLRAVVILDGSVIAEARV